MAKVRAHVFVSGRVQGVFFRQKTKRQAESLGSQVGFEIWRMAEWKQFLKAKNRLLNKLVEYCHHGPSAAKVTNVEVDYGKLTEKNFRTFEIHVVRLSFFLWHSKMRVFSSADVFSAHTSYCGSDFCKVF